jgi:plasmid maintenance system antidote protein VapI
MIDMPKTKCEIVEGRIATNAINRKFAALCDNAAVHHDDVAAELGLSPRLVWSLYKGVYESKLSVDIALAIAVYFDMSIDQLLE